ncbi:hypothetical protein SS50377_22704 [Spironucleus salmonicida]|uniref:Uncharacterized protein n=1 Tax=Spironucleus salmonicida TaxID=348837 RepID=V6LKD7_9EUKA|nr:hypothetical protein SS50377_22704 [Spironucleus salmonicida]|eukprot:EST44181.1 Hypothetical protein SS50377_15985 [Spironucleus salmonicida]
MNRPQIASLQLQKTSNLLQPATKQRIIPRMLANIRTGRRSVVISVSIGHRVNIFSFLLPTVQLVMENQVAFGVHGRLRPLPQGLMAHFSEIARGFAEFRLEIVSRLNLQDTISCIIALTECSWAEVHVRESAVGTVIRLQEFCQHDAQARLQRLYDLTNLLRPEKSIFKIMEICLSMKIFDVFQKIHFEFNFSLPHIFAVLARQSGFRAWPSNPTCVVFELQDDIFYELNFEGKDLFNIGNGGLNTRSFGLQIACDPVYDELVLRNRAKFLSKTILIRTGVNKDIYEHFYTKIRTNCELTEGPKFYIDGVHSIGRFTLLEIVFTGVYGKFQNLNHSIRHEILLWKRLDNNAFFGIPNVFRAIPSRLYGPFSRIYGLFLGGGGEILLENCTERDAQIAFDAMPEACFQTTFTAQRMAAGALLFKFPVLSRARILQVLDFVNELVRPFQGLPFQPRVLTALGVVLARNPVDLTTENWQNFAQNRSNLTVFFHLLLLKMSVFSWIVGAELVVFEEKGALYQVNFRQKYDIFQPKVPVIQAKLVEFYRVPELQFQDWKIIFHLQLMPEIVLLRREKCEETVRRIVAQLLALDVEVTPSFDVFNTYVKLVFRTSRLAIVRAQPPCAAELQPRPEMTRKMAFLRYIAYNAAQTRSLVRTLFGLAPPLVSAELFECVTQIVRRRPFFSYARAVPKREQAAGWLEVSMRFVDEFPTIVPDAVQRAVACIFEDDIAISKMQALRCVLQIVKGAQQARLTGTIFQVK